MIITHISNIADINHAGDTSIALGNFDGVHVGHMEIIRRCVNYAEKNSLISTVITFSPHPRSILNSRIKHKCISTLEEKLSLIKSAGVQQCIVINFDLPFSKLSHEEFLEKYLIYALNPKALFTGYNFCFGYNKKGDAEWLYKKAPEYGIYYEAVSEVTLEHQTVSSSNIKRLLSLGSVETASKILGRGYIIKGIVEEGEKAGSKLLGTPTANMSLNPEIYHPIFGVYLSKITHEDETKYGISSLGVRPALNPVEAPLLETHILDFEGNLYGKSISVELLQFLRPERKYISLDGLIYQIKRDIISAKYALSHILGAS